MKFPHKFFTYLDRKEFTHIIILVHSTAMEHFNKFTYKRMFILKHTPVRFYTTF